MNNSLVRSTALRVALLTMALAPLAGMAQASNPVPGVPAAPLVHSIRVKAEGGEVSEEFVLGHVALRVGQPFSRDAVSATVRALFATGRFNQATVVPDLDPKTGEVNLVVMVEPRPVLVGIDYDVKDWGDQVEPAKAEKTDKKPDAKVEDKGEEKDKPAADSDIVLEDIKKGEPLDPAALRRAEVKLQTELRKKRPFTIVTSTMVKVPKGVRVKVLVREGIELKVDHIHIEGASALSEDDVISGADLKATTWRWWKFSWLTSSGRLDPDEYRKDCQRVRDYYRTKGFLDIQIEDQDPEKACTVKDLSGNSGWLDIIIRVKEGRRYTVGKVTITGNRLGTADPVFSTENLQKVLVEPSLRRGAHPIEVDKLLTGDWYSTGAVEAATEKLQEYYGQMGYLNARVELQRVPNLETGAIDLKFNLDEGQRFTVRSIDIQGNLKTRSNVIARELALSPGETFDLARARVSEARLKNTQFFEEVRVLPVPTPVPGQDDMRIVVKEGPTGQVSFGAGYSTVEQLVGFVEYSEGNFDYTNPEGWYRGGGQKFRFRVSAGTLSNSLEHSFEEPALWDRDLAVGYQLSRVYSGYQSVNYSVITEDVGVYARRRIWGLIEGKIQYDLRRVDVTNVTPQAPVDVQIENGNPKTISSITLSAVRDTRDEYNFPTKGSRISLSEEIAGNGLGGDLSYFKTELRTGKWFLLSPSAEQTLSVVARVGAINGAGSYLPFYERFYLGGAYDMRGFNYNEVGSAATWDTTNGNQPMGGLTYGYFSTEYLIKAADNFRFATFYDYGFVNRPANDFSQSGANSDVGIGLRILLGGAVMRLDFGFPLQFTTDPATGAKLNSPGMKFNFSFGTVF